MNPTLELSVIIPVYGSASILPALADRLEASLSPALGAGNFEVILVHDCGPDDAWAVIESLVVTVGDCAAAGDATEGGLP